MQERLIVLLMKFLLLSLLFLTRIYAVENPSTPDKEISEVSQRENSNEAIIEELFATLGQTEFAAALKQAKEANIHPQVILEARFLNLIDLGENSAIAAMAAELVEKRDSFDPEKSEVFAYKEDWLGIVHYSQALEALGMGDKAGFKKHITEAFWLSPRQAQAFGRHIEKLRQEEAMQAIQSLLDKSLKSQSDAKITSLAELMEGNKALVLYFWSPLSQEIQVNMDDFIITTQTCAKNKMPVLAVLTGSYPGIIEDAEMMRKGDAKDANCQWFMESNRDSISGLLHVRDLPTMAVVSAQGRVLFNGHPSDQAFWNTLEKISPGFKRPNRNEKDGL